MIDRIGAVEIQQYAHLKDFLPLLQQRGEVIVVKDAQFEIDPIYNFLDYLGHSCLYIFFSPPDVAYSEIACPKIFISSFEEGQPKPISMEGVQRSLAGITFCQESINILRQEAPGEWLLKCIPPPLWDEYQQLYNKYFLAESATYPIETNGNIIDTNIPTLQPAAVVYKVPLGRRLISIFHAFSRYRLDLYRIRQHIGRRRQYRFYSTKIEFSGIVYTAIINPKHRHKDWKNLILEFCKAFEHLEDATLVIKMVGIIEHKTEKAAIRLLRNLSVQCRIILINCHLNQDQYKNLIRSTTYIINATHTKVLGSSLLEFMSAGKPAISPKLEPMSPLTQENAFLTVGLLNELLKESYRLAKNNPDQYHRMSESATKALMAYCSKATVEPRFNALMDTVEAKL